MPGSIIVGVLRALLTLDSAEFESGVRRAVGSTQQFERSLGRFGQQATQAGTVLTGALTVPLVGIGAAATKASIDFESSFAGVRKTVDATEEQFTALAAGFRGLSKEIPVNVNEINRIGEAAGQLGIHTENILGFTRVMADLGATTNLSADAAATSLARFANITGMSQDDFDRLGATIVALGNNFATTESEIVDFGQRIAGAGRLAGLSEPQILAIGAAMSSVGVQAEAGGTSVQKVLNAMTEAVATGNDQMEIFATTAGMTSEEFARAFREDAGTAFAAFVSGLGEQGDSAFATLDELGLSNERVIRAFLSLAGAGDLLTETLKVAGDGWRENTALTKEAEQRYKTTSSQLTLLWNSVKDVAITLGDALVPVLLQVVELVRRLMPLVEGAAAAFAAMPPGVQTVVVAMAAFAAALGPVLIVVGQMALGIQALIPLLTVVLPGALAAIMPFLGPVGLIAAGVAAVLAAWYYWDEITEIVSGVYGAVKTWLVDRFSGLVDALKAKVYSVIGFFRDMYDQVVGNSYVPDMVDEIQRQMRRLDEAMVQPARAAAAQTADAFAPLMAPMVLGAAGLSGTVLGGGLSFGDTSVPVYGASGFLGRQVLASGPSGGSGITINIDASESFYDTPASVNRLADKVGSAVLDRLRRQ